MNGLNLSKLKKISTDKSTTTFKHPNGHTLKIAHKGLSPKYLEELSKLPLHKAEGGDVSEEEGQIPEEADQKLKDSGINININAQPQQPVAPTPIPQAQPVQATPVPQVQAQPQKQNLATQGKGPGGAPASMDAGQANPQSTTQAEQKYPSIEEPQKGEDSLPTQDLTKQEPQQEEPSQITHEQHAQQIANELKPEDLAFEQDLNNGHITPQTYSDLFAKKSTLGKIGTIFGLLLSGAGSGLTGQPNALLSMMNNEIQNDLEAQKQSKGNAQNFIKLNQMHQMNQAQIKKMVQEGKLTEAQADLSSAEANTKATALANMQMNRAALHSLSQNIQNLPPGPQRQQAEQTLGMMYNSVNTENFDIADRAASASAYYRMMLGSGSGGSGGNPEESFQKRTSGMRLLSPAGADMAKNLEDKHFPGLEGQASVPLSGGDREAINSGITFDKKLAHFMDWTRKHSGDLNPADRKAGQALAAEVQGAYRQATNGGVYKEGEQNFISKLIDSTPTKFFNEIRVMPQLEAIAGENQSRLDQLVKSKGFKGYSSSHKGNDKKEKAIDDMMTGGGGEKSPPQENTIERMYKGRVAVYDSNKKFLHYK